MVLTRDGDEGRLSEEAFLRDFAGDFQSLSSFQGPSM
jgi:hypothetical protein